MKKMILALALALAFTSAACGKNSANPMAPTAPTIANYAGNWSGTYMVSGCTQSGQVAYANICSATGNVASFSMALTQSGSSVSGTFTMGSVTFTGTSGTVGADGSLRLTGTDRDGSITTIVVWALNNNDGRLSGTMTLTMTSSSLTGNVILVGIMNSATR